MRAMDSRQPSLLEPTAPARTMRTRPRTLARPARSAVEIVRHADGPVEVKVSGLVDGAERRIRQWQGVAASLFLIMVVGAALSIVVVALRWDYERGRTVQMLQADLQMARVRERCWEALARFTPRSADDVVTPAKRDGWVARCTSGELDRVNAKR
ncbi:MAG TPA: hypothetical protein VL086_19230 [Candidatus Nitrosotalea sp.]|nr:hypothetical protein [Candidatus Nitrosotalea sp.]